MQTKTIKNDWKGMPEEEHEMRTPIHTKLGELKKKCKQFVGSKKECFFSYYILNVLSNIECF